MNTAILKTSNLKNTAGPLTSVGTISIQHSSHLPDPAARLRMKLNENHIRELIVYTSNLIFKNVLILFI